MKLSYSENPATKELPEGFYYISQDNYYIANLNSPNSDKPEKYLYSDSATSCVIVIVEGKDKNGNPIVALSHLSRTERFLKFFEIVAATFAGTTNVFAQGANPPSPGYSSETNKYSYDALQNQQTVINWVNDHMYVPSSGGTPPNWYIEQSSLALGTGNPQLGHRSCFGVDLETMIVSNQEFELTSVQRDPTLGSQVLYCVFGLNVTPKIVLQHSTVPFNRGQIEALVTEAVSQGWLDILGMTKDELLNKYSSTPMYEVPWFFGLLRESANYVKNNQ